MCLFVGDPEPAPAAPDADARPFSPMSRAAPEEGVRRGAADDVAEAPPRTRNELPPASANEDAALLHAQNATSAEDSSFLHWLFGGGLF